MQWRYRSCAEYLSDIFREVKLGKWVSCWEDKCQWSKYGDIVNDVKAEDEGEL